MKTTVTKYENIDVEIDDEQIIYLMCQLLKNDYFEWKAIDLKDSEKELFDAMELVYSAYAGKPIDLVERFTH